MAKKNTFKGFQDLSKKRSGSSSSSSSNKINKSKGPDLAKMKLKSNKRKKDIENVKLKNNYFKNVLKSVKYSVGDVIKEQAGDVYDIAQTTKNTIKYQKENLKNLNSSTNQLANKIKSTPEYRDVQTGFKNIMSDLKSGKFNNRERSTKLGDDFGGDDFGFNDDSNFDDMFGESGSSSSSSSNDFDSDFNAGDLFSDASSSTNNNYIDNRKSVKILNQSSSFDSGKLDVSLTKVKMQNDNRNTSFIGDLFNRHSNQVSSGLESINNNVNAIIDFNNSSMNNYIEVSTQFYEDNINALNTINETLSSTFELLKTIGIAQEEQNEEVIANLAKESIGNFEATKAQWKKNLDEAIGDRIGMSPSAIKEFLDIYNQGMGGDGDDRSFLAGVADNPLGFLMKMGVSKAMGPQITRSLNDLNEVVANLPKNFNRKLLRMQRDLDNGYYDEKWSKGKRSFFEFFTQVFGISDKEKFNYDVFRKDKESLNKVHGFTNQDHIALTKVIPKYLSSISYNTARLNGDKAVETTYDYTTGKFSSPKRAMTEIRKEIREDIHNTIDNNSEFEYVLGRIYQDKKITKKDTKENIKKKEQINKNNRLHIQRILNNREILISLLAQLPDHLTFKEYIIELKKDTTKKNKLRNYIREHGLTDKDINELVKLYDAGGSKSRGNLKEDQILADTREVINESFEKLAEANEYRGTDYSKKDLLGIGKNNAIGLVTKNNNTRIETKKKSIVKDSVKKFKEDFSKDRIITELEIARNELQREIEGEKNKKRKEKLKKKKEEIEKQIKKFKKFGSSDTNAFRRTFSDNFAKFVRSLEKTFSEGDFTGNYDKEHKDIISKLRSFISDDDIDAFSSGGLVKTTKPVIVGDRPGSKSLGTAGPYTETVQAGQDANGNVVLNVLNHKDTLRTQKGKRLVQAADGVTVSSDQSEIADIYRGNTTNKLLTSVQFICNKVKGLKENSDYQKQETEERKQKELNPFKKLKEKFNDIREKGKNTYDNIKKNGSKYINEYAIAEAERRAREQGITDQEWIDNEAKKIEEELQPKKLAEEKIAKPLDNLGRKLFGKMGKSDKDYDETKGKVSSGFDTVKDEFKGYNSKGISRKWGVAAGGVLGAMFLPGGPIFGGLMGSGLGLIAQSDKLQTMLFGEKGKEKIHEIAGKVKKFGIDNKGLIAGGLIGSMFLPGGPIFGTLLGAFGGKFIDENKQKLTNLLFGIPKKGEDGTYKGQLGVFPKMALRIQKRFINTFAKFGLHIISGLSNLLNKTLFKPIEKLSIWVNGLKKYAEMKIKNYFKNKFAIGLRTKAKKKINDLKIWGKNKATDLAKKRIDKRNAKLEARKQDKEAEYLAKAQNLANELGLVDDAPEFIAQKVEEFRKQDEEKRNKHIPISMLTGNLTKKMLQSGAIEKDKWNKANEKGSKSEATKKIQEWTTKGLNKIDEMNNKIREIESASLENQNKVLDFQLEVVEAQKKYEKLRKKTIATYTKTIEDEEELANKIQQYSEYLNNRLKKEIQVIADEHGIDAKFVDNDSHIVAKATSTISDVAKTATEKVAEVSAAAEGATVSSDADGKAGKSIVDIQADAREQEKLEVEKEENSILSKLYNWVAGDEKDQKKNKGFNIMSLFAGIMPLFSTIKSGFGLVRKGIQAIIKLPGLIKKVITTVTSIPAKIVGMKDKINKFINGYDDKEKGHIKGAKDKVKDISDKIAKMKEKRALAREAKKDAATASDIATEKQGFLREKASRIASAVKKTEATATETALDHASGVKNRAIEGTGAVVSGASDATGGAVEGAAKATSGTIFGIPAAVAMAAAGATAVGLFAAKKIKEMKKGKAPKTDDGETDGIAKDAEKSKKSVFDKLKNNPIGKFIGGVVKGFKEAFGGVIDIMKKIIGGIKKVFGQLSHPIKLIKDGIKKVAKFLEPITKALGKIGGVLAGFAAGPLAALGAVGGAIGKGVGAVAKGAKNLAGKAIKGVGAVAKGVGGIGKKVLGGVKGIFGGKKKSSKDKGSATEKVTTKVTYGFYKGTIKLLKIISKTLFKGFNIDPSEVISSKTTDVTRADNVKDISKNPSSNGADANDLVNDKSVVKYAQSLSNSTIAAAIAGKSLQSIHTNKISDDAKSIIAAIIQTNQLLVKGFQLDALVSEGGNVSSANSKSSWVEALGKLLGAGKGSEDNKVYKATEHNSKTYTDGFPYYSQTDPAWSNLPFASNNMGTDGCGPTAMAMVASKLTGTQIDPLEMAAYANKTGRVTNQGTLYDFIDTASSGLRLSNKKEYKPSSGDIKSGLKRGPVILAGSSNSNRIGSPFTTEGHYLVATGVNDDGTIKVYDPRGSAYNGSYSASELSKLSDVSWNFGTGGTSLSRNVLGYAMGEDEESQETNSGLADWIKAVKFIKAKTAGPKPIYYAEGKKFYNFSLDGKEVKYRPDCSGIINAMLHYYNSDFNYDGGTGGGYGLTSFPALEKLGFKHLPWDPKNLQEGDIIGKNGHVEVFSHMGSDGKTRYTYNGGNTKSLANPGDEISNSVFTETYRLTNGKSNNDHIGEDSSSSSSSSDSSSSTSNSISSSSSENSGNGNILSRITEMISGFASELFGGKNSYKESLNSSSSSSSDSSSSTSGTDNNTTVTDVKLPDSEYRKRIWNYFKEQGLTDAGVSGLMGCWQCESSNNPRRVEGDYTGYFPGYDKFFSDQGVRDDYTKKLLANLISRGVISNGNGYIVDGHYYPGVGLAQWTAGRAKKLYDYASSKEGGWGSLDNQLGFFQKEISENSGYSNAYNKLKSINDVTEATKTFGYGYEHGSMPWNMMSDRINKAHAIYKELQGTSGESGVEEVKKKKKKSRSVQKAQLDSMNSQAKIQMEKAQAFNKKAGKGTGSVSVKPKVDISKYDYFRTASDNINRTINASELSERTHIDMELVLKFLEEIATNTGYIAKTSSDLLEKEFKADITIENKDSNANENKVVTIDNGTVDNIFTGGFGNKDMSGNNGDIFNKVSLIAQGN